MAPRRRSPSVDSRWRPERRPSRHRERHRSRSHSRQRRRSPAPSSRRERESVNISHRSDKEPTQDKSRRRSHNRSRSTSSRRVPKSDVYRPEAPVVGRRRADSISSVKRRGERSASPSRDPSRKHRRQGSADTDRARSPVRRDERPRRTSPDTYFPPRRAPSRDSLYRSTRRPQSPRERRPRRTPSPLRPSRPLDSHTRSFREASFKHRDIDRWGRDSLGADTREQKRRHPLESGPRPRDRERRDTFRRRSLSPESRRSPGQGLPRRAHSPRHRSPTPPTSKNRYEREEAKVRDRAIGYRQRPSRSPSGEKGKELSKRHPEDRGRERVDRKEDRVQETPRRRRRHSRGSRRSATPPSDRERDERMSWRPPYDHRGPPPPRGGWPLHDPRYSHSPPYHQGYHGTPPGPHQPSYSPQQSPYPPQPGQPDRGYFQQSPPFNHHQSPPYHHGSPPSQSNNGTYPPRGGYRGSQPPYNQRYDQRFQQPPSSAQGPGPHVRNLSWTPKTGTRGGHAPTMHGANAQTPESTTPAQEQATVFNGAENPFRPASKELRVDDEAGKAGKSQAGDVPSVTKTATVDAAQHSPSIRFGLPKSGAAPPAPKPNAFQAKKNPFDQSANGPSATNDDRYSSRPSTHQYDSRSNRENDSRRDSHPPLRKGPKPALKQSINRNFYDRRKSVHNVTWSRVIPVAGDRELRKKLERLRSLVLSKGHALNELHWTEMRPPPEFVDDEDPPGLAEALQNKSALEEEAYRKHPNRRPKGEQPRLKDGESLDVVFKKDVFAVKYKVRRPQKILPENYRSSNVYYRKPGNESVVGFGTYGKVFKAQHIYKGKDVALKRLRMEAEKDGFPITAMREMKILKHLEQREAEGVIRLHELLYEVNFQNSVACFMVFEYMPHDLTGLLNHPTFKLTQAQKKDMSYQMIDAIGFMHKQGVIHRDIKAANILVSHQGEIKLADFGLARFYDMDRQLHYTNRVVTIWYRAPELLYGQTEYGPAIDVWATACVIVEIFTRHAIFPGNGKDLNQLIKVWEILGFPTPEEWPNVSKTEWYFMMRPKEMMPNIFKEKYSGGDLGKQTTPELLNLLADMLKYDPEKRPSCDECLQHPFFTSEEPKPRRVTTELEKLGDWHEFESKKAKRMREAEDRVDKDLKEGPPSCGQYVKEERRDRGYRKDMMVRQDKRGANFSPIEPEAKKIKP